MKSLFSLALRAYSYIESIFRRRPIRSRGYVDGLNLGHSTELLGDPDCQQCDPAKLIERCLEQEDALLAVNYYVAVARHLGESVKNNWLAFTKALEARGIRVVLGRFKKKKRTVFLPTPASNRTGGQTRHKISVYEEKETDVNIAIDMIADAKDGKCDKMFLISGDSDFLPVVRYLLDMGIKVVVIAPPHQKVVEFRALATQRPGELYVRQLDMRDIRLCQLADPIFINGKKICLFV